MTLNTTTSTRYGHRYRTPPLSFTRCSHHFRPLTLLFVRQPLAAELTAESFQKFLVSCHDPKEQLYFDEC